MSSDNQLVATETPPVSILGVIAAAARNPEIDVDKMERLLALHERVLKQQAEQEFNAAMSVAQEEMPRVHRDAKNPSTGSFYTRLESLNLEAVPIYTRHGFSLSFGTADCPVPEWHRITCTVAHKGGHSRHYQVDLPRDDTGAKGLANKTKMHGAGSTFSYGRRYLTLLIFNISLTNEDDDGNRGKQAMPPGPMKATEKTRAWFLSQIADIAEEAWNFANEHGWLAPDEKLDAWPLAHVPVSKADLAALRAEITEWAKA